MKKQVSWWQKILSYIIEVELERVESEHGHDLSLCLSDGRFQLNAKRAIYSWEDKYDNFYKAFQHLFQQKIISSQSENIFWRGDKNSSVLILGFGLGSIPQMLEKNFKRSFYYTGVEIDEEIIYLAESYITHQLKSSIQLIQAPAEIFIETTTEKFDLICVDIFINDKIPAVILSHMFLESVKELLNPNGVVLFNHLANRDQERKNGHTFFKNAFQNIFPNTQLLDVDGNFIFVGKL